MSVLILGKTGAQKYNHDLVLFYDELYGTYKEH